MSKTMPKITFEIDPEVPRHPEAADQHPQRRLEEAVRDQNTRLGFYRACAHKPCRRAQACVVEADSCFRRWWPHVHPQVRVLERTFDRALFDGAPVEEARRRASAASQDWWRRFMAGEFSEEARAFLAGPLAKLPPV